MRKVVVIAAAFIVAAFAPAWAADDAAQAVRDWLTTLDANPAWTATYGDIASHGAEVTVTNLKIAAEGGDKAAIDVPRLIVVGFAAVAAGSFTAQALLIPAITIEAGPYHYALDTLALSGVALPAIKAFGIDPQHLFTSTAQVYGWLAAAQIDEARLARLTLTRPDGHPDDRITYDTIWLKGLANGRLDAASIGGFGLDGNDPDGPVHIDGDAVEIADIDFTAIMRFMGQDAAGRSGNDWQTALGSASYENLHIDSKDSQLGIGRMLIEGLDLRPTGAGVAEAMDRLMAKPEPDEDEANAIFVKHGLDLASSFSFRHLALHNLTARGEDETDANLGAIDIRDVSFAGIGSLALDDLAVNAPKDSTKVTLERFALADFAFPPVGAIRAAIKAAEAGEMPDVTTLRPTLSGLEALGVGVTRESDDPVTLRRFNVDAARFLARLPMSIDVDLRGLKVPLSLVDKAGSRELLKAIGYGALETDLGYRVDWHEATGQVEIRDLYADIKDMGRVSLDTTFSGVTRELLAQPTPDPAALADITLEDARLTFKDASITDRLIKYFARQKGVPPDQFRDTFVAGLPLLLLLAGPDDPTLLVLGQQASDAAAKFAADPGTLTITLKPKARMSLLEIMEKSEESPPALIPLFDITIAAQ